MSPSPLTLSRNSSPYHSVTPHDFFLIVLSCNHLFALLIIFLYSWIKLLKDGKQNLFYLPPSTVNSTYCLPNKYLLNGFKSEWMNEWMNILASSADPYQSQYSPTMILSHWLQNSGAISALPLVFTPKSCFSSVLSFRSALSCPVL